MSRKFRLDEKTIIPIATSLLFAIGAVKILLFGEHYNLAVNNYINFSNILVYTFDILRALLYYSAPVVIFIIWKDTFIPQLLKPNAVWISIAILCISIAMFIYCYYWITMTYWANVWVKALVEVGMFCAAICIKASKRVGNFEIVKLALLVCFLYIFLKIESKYVVYEIDKEKNNISKIVLKADGKDSMIFTDHGFYLILNTTDFLFLYNDTTKRVTTIPMANVFLFTPCIVDTAKGHNRR